MGLSFSMVPGGVHGILGYNENWDFVTQNYRSRREQIKSVVFAHSDGIYAKKIEKNRTNVMTALWTVYDNYVVRNLSEIIEKLHVLISIEFLITKELFLLSGTAVPLTRWPFLARRRYKTYF
mgnify:CR=1 FL=1